MERKGRSSGGAFSASRLLGPAQPPVIGEPRVTGHSRVTSTPIKVRTILFIIEKIVI